MPFVVVVGRDQKVPGSVSRFQQVLLRLKSFDSSKEFSTIIDMSNIEYVCQYFVSICPGSSKWSIFVKSQVRQVKNRVGVSLIRLLIYLSVFVSTLSVFSQYSSVL